MNTLYFQFLFTIYFIWIDTITRKQHHINRSVDDDPFALDGFGDCMFEFEIFQNPTIEIFFAVAAPASVIGIGGDNSNLSNEKDQYDHVMSPFHRKSIYFLFKTLEKFSL